MMKKVAFILILILSYSPIFGSQDLILPDCSQVESINFDKKAIIKSQDRFLFEGKKDSIDALYCYAKRINSPELEAISLYMFATEYREIFENPEQFILAIKYLDESIKISRENHLDVPLFWALEKKATIFNSNYLYDQANVFAEELVEIATRRKDSTNFAEAYVILGRLRRDQNRFNEADSLLKLALDYKTNSLASTRNLGYNYLHLSNLRRLQKRYHESINLADQGMIYAQQLHDKKNGIYSYLMLEKIQSNIELGNYDIAIRDLQEIEPNTRHAEWVEVQRRYIKGMIYERSGDYQQAMNEYSKAKELSQDYSSSVLTLQIVDRMLSLMYTQGNVSPEIMKLMDDVHEANNSLLDNTTQGNMFKQTYYNLLEERQTSDKLEGNLVRSRRLLWFSIITLLVMAGIINFAIQQLKLKNTYYQQAQELNRELQTRNQGLKATNKQMAKSKDELYGELKQKLLLLNNQTTMIDQLRELVRTDEEFSKESRQKLTNLMDIESNNDIINDINVTALELNSELLTKLSTDFPSLTSNDLKLCLYLSMNLSTKEIAQLMYKTTEALKVSRSRLRKKLGIHNTPTSLSAFLNRYKSKNFKYD